MSDCSKNPEEHEKPAWAIEEANRNEKKVYGNSKYGSYYTGMNFAAEERLWNQIRKQSSMQSVKSTTSVYIQPTNPPAMVPWSSETPKQIPQTHQQHHQQHQTNYRTQTTRNIPTTKPTTKTTTTTQTTKSTIRPTLPSDWGFQPNALP